MTGRDRKTIRRLTSKLDPFREYVLGRALSEDPCMNAELLYDEIRERGYAGGRSILKEFLHPFRELAREKVTRRFETQPGKQAQVDWGVFKKPERKRMQGFVMTLSGREACTSTSPRPRRWPHFSSIRSAPSSTWAAYLRRFSTTIAT